MIRAALFASLMLASPVVFAVAGTRVSPGNQVFIGPIPAYNGAQSTFYVDGTLGSDGNSCTAAGASACQTIQGAISRMGVFLATTDDTTNYQVTINIAAGAYAGFTMQGIRLLNKSSGLAVNFVGALAQVPGTGSYTGTGGGDLETGSTTGVGNFSFVPTVGPAWVVNAYVGYFVMGTAGLGAGSVLPISANSATAVEYTTAGLTNPFNATSTIQIMAPAVFIDGSVTLGDNAGSTQLLYMDFTNTTPATSSFRFNPQSGFTSFFNCRVSSGSTTQFGGGHHSVAFSRSYLYGTTFSFAAVRGAGVSTASSVINAAFAVTGAASGNMTRATVLGSNAVEVAYSQFNGLPVKTHGGVVTLRNMSSYASNATAGNYACVTVLTNACLSLQGSTINLFNVYVSGGGTSAGVGTGAIDLNNGSTAVISGGATIAAPNVFLRAAEQSTLTLTGTSATGTAPLVGAFAASGGRVLWVNAPLGFASFPLFLNGVSYALSAAPVRDFAGFAAIGPATNATLAHGTVVFTAGSATATVRSGCVPVCTYVSTTRPFSTVACSVTATTLTVTSSNAADTGFATYFCP